MHPRRQFSLYWPRATRTRLAPSPCRSETWSAMVEPRGSSRWRTQPVTRRSLGVHLSHQIWVSLRKLLHLDCLT